MKIMKNKVVQIDAWHITNNAEINARKNQEK